MPGLVSGRHAPTLTASLASPTPLRYASGRERVELPEHVRAGSAVRRWEGRLVVVQDDVHALALLDERTGQVAPLLLPAGADGGHVAGAEDSPDTFRDGQVLGCRFGLLDGDACVYTDVLDDGGRPSGLKLEGIDFVREADDGGLEFVVVADMDDPHVPALRATLNVRGAEDVRVAMARERSDS